jgi:hypothetical protein
MAKNSTAIPLYMNNDAMMNVFTIAIQELTLAQSVTNRNQMAFKISTPLSELSCDLFGKYMQGSFEASIASENVANVTIIQKTINAYVFSNLKRMLNDNNMLKNLSSQEVLKTASKGDFVEFECNLTRNPILQRTSNLVRMLEMENFNDQNTSKDKETAKKNDEAKNVKSEHKKKIPNNINRQELLKYLKQNLDTAKQDKCLRYIARDLCGDGCDVIVPIRQACLLDSEDYLTGGKVTVFGKVMYKYNQKSDSVEAAADDDVVPWRSKTMFDYFDFDKFNDISNDLFANCNVFGHTNTIVENFSKDNCMEIMPLSIYI